MLGTSLIHFAPALALVAVAGTGVLGPATSFAQGALGAAPIDGERALLGRSSLSQPASPAVSVHRIGHEETGSFSSLTLVATGAVALAYSSDEARYGTVPAAFDGDRPLLTISLGATSAEGSLTLMLSGDQLPPKGRYPVHPGEDRGAGAHYFRAFFAAGTPEQPVGAFHGESGWVVITDSIPGRISGEFEIVARGFLATDLNHENRWVTVRGRFEARGDRERPAIGDETNSPPAT